VVDDRTEEEQVEALKKWFGENGTSLIVSIVIVLAVVFGYRTWETQGRESGEAASAMYQNLQDAVAVGPLDELSDENISTGKFLADQLKSEHSGSSYAFFAAMQMAKIAVEKEDLEEASKQLSWILDNGADEKLSIIANLRLAKVKLGLGEHEQALTQLDTVKSGGHESSYEETRGDIYFAMGKNTEAREAYQRAVTLQGENIKPLTRMKLDDLVVPSNEIALQADELVEAQVEDGAESEESDQ